MAWVNKTKSSAGSYTHKSKIYTNFERGRLLTPDGNQVLVGSSEDLVLIYQAFGTQWTGKTKTPII